MFRGAYYFYFLCKNLILGQQREKLFLSYGPLFLNFISEPLRFLHGKFMLS